MMRSGARGLFASLALAAAALPALAQNAIQSINSSQQAGAEVVRIELSEPLAAVPAGFAVQAPPRDRARPAGRRPTRSASRRVEINQGNLRSVNVAQAGERTRLVLNLKQPADYRAAARGQGRWWSSLDSIGAGDRWPARPRRATTRFAESLQPRASCRCATSTSAAAPTAPAASSSTCRTTRSASTSASRARTWSSTSCKIDAARQPAPPPRRDRLRHAGADRRPPSQSGDRVRMVDRAARASGSTAPTRPTTSSCSKCGRMKVDPNKLTQGAGYAGEKLSLNFQNIEVRALLQVIADFTELQHRHQRHRHRQPDAAPEGRALGPGARHHPADQGPGHAQERQRDAGSRRKDELAAKEKLELEAQAADRRLEPLRTQSFQLNYAKAEDIAKGLTGQAQAAAAARRAHPVAARQRRSSSRAPTSCSSPTSRRKLEEVAGADRQDRHPGAPGADRGAHRRCRRHLRPLARRAARRRRPARRARRHPGLQRRRQQPRGASAATCNAVGAQTLQTGATSVDFADTHLRQPAGDRRRTASTRRPSRCRCSTPASNRFLNLEISALEADGKGKVVSSPRVVTADQPKALIEQGTELPYQVATSSGATSLQFRKANLKLEVTPQITPEGNVILDVDVNKDSVGQRHRRPASPSTPSTSRRRCWSRTAARS